MRVPFIDLSRLVRSVRDGALEDFGEVLDRCELVNGPSVTALEQRLSSVLGAPNVVACASGSSALVVALQALGLPRGARVALPDVTFWATYEAIAALGHTPVLLDIDEHDLQLSFDELQRAHDALRLDAVVLPHLFGWASARLREIRAFCAERALPLVEDGAQSFGVQAFGAPLLADARIATLSFYPAKVVGGAMDGGAIVTATKPDADLARSLCNHGRVAHYSHAHVGWNSRMGGLQARYLMRVLDRLDWILATRRAAMEQYRRFAASLDGKVRMIGPPAGQIGNGYLAVLVARDAPGEDLVAALAARGIGAARTYPETLHEQAPAREALRLGDLPRSTAFCRHVVNLPLFAGITPEEVSIACEALAEVLPS